LKESSLIIKDLNKTRNLYDSKKDNHLYTCWLFAPNVQQNVSICACGQAKNAVFEYIEIFLQNAQKAFSFRKINHKSVYQFCLKNSCKFSLVVQ